MFAHFCRELIDWKYRSLYLLWGDVLRLVYEPKTHDNKRDRQLNDVPIPFWLFSMPEVAKCTRENFFAWIQANDIYWLAVVYCWGEQR